MRSLVGIVLVREEYQSSPIAAEARIDLFKSKGG